MSNTKETRVLWTGQYMDFDSMRASGMSPCVEISPGDIVRIVMWDGGIHVERKDADLMGDPSWHQIPMWTACEKDDETIIVNPEFCGAVLSAMHAIGERSEAVPDPSGIEWRDILACTLSVRARNAIVRVQEKAPTNPRLALPALIGGGFTDIRRYVGGAGDVTVAEIRSAAALAIAKKGAKL